MEPIIQEKNEYFYDNNNFFSKNNKTNKNNKTDTMIPFFNTYYNYPYSQYSQYSQYPQYQQYSQYYPTQYYNSYPTYVDNTSNADTTNGINVLTTDMKQPETIKSILFGTANVNVNMNMNGNSMIQESEVNMNNILDNEKEEIINNDELECMPEMDCSNTNVDVINNQSKLVTDDKNKRKSKVNNVKNYRNIVVKDTIYANKLNQNQNDGNTNNFIVNTNEMYNTNEIICSNCGKIGHKFKNCDLAVISYGLICFHKKKIMIPDKSMNHDYFNKRTKKYEDSNNKPTQGNQCNQSQIRILKRNEQLVQSSSIGNNSNNNLQNSVLENQEDTLDSIIQIDDDIPEPIDSGNTKNNANEPIKMKEIYSNKVILIQRRNTIGFIEFLRGKYDVTNFDYIVKLFNMMTFDEKRTLREYDSFDTIRLVIGLKRESVYKTEYDEAKVKFTTLQNHKDGNMIHKLLDKSYTRWTTPEWGLPKGRKSKKEFEIECAVREFSEETGIKYKNICVYRNVKPLEEIYKGINGVIYKHVYYLASIKETEDAIKNMDIVEQGGLINFEVSNVKLFSLNECHKIIRPYYISKLNAIKKGFQLINSLGHFFE
jgi:8-oxo-dGTP pyrophosphatase MutT (NUDIX family)